MARGPLWARIWRRRVRVQTVRLPQPPRVHVIARQPPMICARNRFVYQPPIGAIAWSLMGQNH